MYQYVENLVHLPFALLLVASTILDMRGSTGFMMCTYKIES